MSEEIGQELLEPEGYLQKRRYKITLQCERCGHRWSRVTTKLDGADPPCPITACRELAMEQEIQRRAERLAKMLEEGRAPAHIGQSVITKAVDETAKIVMEDHHMTNLQDNIRAGDMVAPKLPAPMQRQADNYFGSGNLTDRYGARRAKQMSLLGQRAIAGAYRGMAVGPGDVLPGQQGETILRSIGKEPLQRA